MRIIKTFCAFTALFISSRAFAQTTTVNYSTSSLSKSACNVFNFSPPPVIGGLTHYPVSGGVTFNGSSVILQTMGPGQNLGTAYAIAYPFKANYSYTITITAFDTSADPVSSPFLSFGFLTALPDPNVTLPGGCGPVSMNNWGILQQYVAGGTYLTRTPRTYTFGPLLPVSNFSYLFLLANQGSATSSTNVYISKITIVSPTFTLSPASEGNPCGQASAPIVYSVSNNNNVAGISSYTWNLGAPGANGNGWLYQNAPAPQTVTTGVNNLQLRISGCTTPQAISVAANTPAVSYQSNSATAFLFPIPLSISGSSTFCTSAPQSYSVSAAPCSGSITWSCNPAGLLTIIPSGQTAQVSPAPGVIDANVALIASSSTCGSVGQLNITIATGVPNVSCASIGNGTCTIVVPRCTGLYGSGTGYTIPNPAGDGYNLWLWNLTGAHFVDGTTSVITAHNVITTPQYVIPNTGTNSASLSIQPTNVCGYTPSGIPFQYIIVNTGQSCSLAASSPTLSGTAATITADSPANTRFIVSPNPARGILTINAAAPSVSGSSAGGPTHGFTAVEIVDAIGVRRQQKVFGEWNMNAALDISSISPGVYFVRIFDGQAWEVHKVLIAR